MPLVTVMRNGCEKGRRSSVFVPVNVNTVPTSSWRSVTMVPGRKKEWLAPMLFQGSCNAQLFEMWVEQCLMKELHEPTIVVMDNASFHNHKRVQDILAKNYHYVISLPPYSPDLNSIEKTFGSMKRRRQSMPIGTTINQLIFS
ncbi:transposase [Nitrosococcus watsonii]|nr:transposase [Nitrosococcus watsonii]